jgi:STE24 endopeptidase
LSNQDIRSWLIDQVKAFLLGVVLGVIILEVMYALLRLAPDTWWLWLSVILLGFNVLLANLAPILLLPIFYKFKPLAEEHSLLVERLLRLAQTAKTHVQGVYQFDMSSKTNAANAALTGLGKTRRIILGDTLLNNFSDDEIETVLAHELAHHVYRDIPVGILISSLLTLGGLYFVSLVMDWGVLLLGLEGVADVAAMPLLVLTLGLFSFLTIPIENYYSRWREKRADRFALQITQNGEAYASALTRLANQNLSEIDPEPWWELLFYSHPALGKRIRMAMTYKGE